MLTLLLQVPVAPGAPADWDGLGLEQLPFSPMELWFTWFSSLMVSVLYFGFLIGMIYYCYRRDPNWTFWVWIILFVQPFGAIVYFLVRFLPSVDLQNGSLLKRWRKSQSIPRLQQLAAQIGNAHQFVQLGEALKDLNRIPEAQAAFQNALNKDPQNLQALWGAGDCEYTLKNYSEARNFLELALQKDFNFKFGDVSLLYAKTLLALNEPDLAREHLDKHVRKWRTPEALYLLGKLSLEQGDQQRARELLQGVITDLKISPPAIARKSFFWKTRAQRLLRRIPN